MRGTLHWRDTYRVGFHFLYTGEVERERMAADDYGEPRFLVRLLRPRVVYACLDCYARPDVQRYWDQWESGLQPVEE